MTISLQSTTDYLNSRMEIAGNGQEPATLRFDGDGLALLRAMPAARRSPLRLVLPAGTILERKVSLPLAAAHDLAQVLHFEMNRLTPFASADVFWDWTLAAQDKRLGKLDIRLRLARRDAIAPILGTLQNYGLQPDYIESWGPQAGAPARSIRLKQGKAARSSRNPLRMAAFAACGLLFFVICAMPFLRQGMELSTIRQQIAAVRPAVTAASSLRQFIEADAQSSVVLRVERGMSGDPLQALAAVSDALPDGTWLTDLTLQQRLLHLSGESHAAAQLIGKLAGVGLISDPAFAAPVTSDADHHTDVFTISAEIRP